MDLKICGTNTYNRKLSFSQPLVLTMYQMYLFDNLSHILHFTFQETFSYHYALSQVSVVGTATRYGLDGPGIESPWGGIFRL